jgi:hypothetical protein
MRNCCCCSRLCNDVDVVAVDGGGQRDPQPVAQHVGQALRWVSAAEEISFQL